METTAQQGGPGLSGTDLAPPISDADQNVDGILFLNNKNKCLCLDHSEQIGIMMLNLKVLVFVL